MLTKPREQRRRTHGRGVAALQAGYPQHMPGPAIKRAAAAIGMDAHEIGGQSLRAGCLTWLSMQNVNIHRIQEHSGHKDIRNLIDYIRKPKTAKDSPPVGTKWTE